MTDVGRMLWQGCHVLRHEGVAYDEYVDQLSLLLFIKMSSELPSLSDAMPTWSELLSTEDERLLAVYDDQLTRFAEQGGLVGEIFDGAQSRFRSARGLKSVLQILDNTHWSALDRDVQGDAFEYLLERTAAEGKQGAGQYFTPRPLVRAIIACIKPGAKATDRLISDPASGTGGFLVEAIRSSSVQLAEAQQKLEVRGNEIVPRVRRMALMNLVLHGATRPRIDLSDALVGAESNGLYDVVVANPPFGSRSGSRPSRPDFWVQTGNKQINFTQHIILSLRRGGRAAIVLPDNCFAGDSSTEQLWERVFEDHHVHTILRLPKGTFAPYAAGVMTNVVFLSAVDGASDETWIYDGRTDSRKPTGRKPMKASELSEFVNCFGDDPDGRAPRAEPDSPEGRWTRHTATELRKRSYKLENVAATLETPRFIDLDDTFAMAEDGLEAALEAVRKLREATRG